MDDATRRLGALLAPLTNYERTRPDAPRFTLATMRALLERLGSEARLPGFAVQIGGSKGKGTTAAFLETLGRDHGLRTGVYSSPHVSSMLERVRVDGEPVTEEALTGACRRVLEVAAGLEPAPSFFEVMTAAALLVFAAAGVDLAVLEVGLGGRLDATTAVEVDVSVVTSIELEHTELLGHTVRAIAGEKAFVLRPGRVGLHACEGPAADVLEAHAAAVGCRLLALGRDLHAVVRRRSGNDHEVVLRGRDGTELEVELRDAPPWEVRALGLAFGALRELVPHCRVPRVLDRPRLPGRFEVRPEPDGELIVLDGAHTERSAGLLADELRIRHPGRGARLLCASARGKRWRHVLDALRPAVAQFFVGRVRGTASEEPQRLVEFLRRRGASAEVVPDAATGLEALRAGPGPRVVAGSFYLVGEVRDLLDGRR